MYKLFRVFMIIGLILMIIFDMIYFVSGTMAQVALFGMILFAIGAMGNRKLEKNVNQKE